MMPEQRATHRPDRTAGRCTSGRRPNRGKPMTVNAILKHQGSDVVTIDRSETVTRAVALLDEKWIGAVLVTEVGHYRVIGVFSERDLVRGIARQGADCLKMRVDTLMRSEERRVGTECVSTCRSRWARYYK